MLVLVEPPPNSTPEPLDPSDVPFSSNLPLATLIFINPLIRIPVELAEIPTKLKLLPLATEMHITGIDAVVRVELPLVV